MRNPSVISDQHPKPPYPGMSGFSRPPGLGVLGCAKRPDLPWPRAATMGRALGLAIACGTPGVPQRRSRRGWGAPQQVTHRGRLPRTDRFGGTSRCGSLTVRDVSFGGAWPGSRIRYDEGGHSRRAAARHRWSRTSEYFAPELSSAATLGFTLIGSVTWCLALGGRRQTVSSPAQVWACRQKSGGWPRVPCFLLDSLLPGLNLLQPTFLDAVLAPGPARHGGASAGPAKA